MMKKIILLLLVTINISIFAQKELKEGVISMKITMSSENEQVNTSLAMMGNLTTKTYFKGEKSRTEMKSPMAGNNTTIIDNDTKEMLVLIDNPMIGKKYMKNSINVSEDELKDITVTETGDSKTILNYKCQGYNVIVKKDGVETKMTMYTTDKITAPNQNSSVLGGKLKGFPMYIIMNINQGGMAMTTTMEVIEVKNEKVDDAKFNMTALEGYEKVDKLTGM
jgi:hypothetical protein